jgi:hypothetical protein
MNGDVLTFAQVMMVIVMSTAGFVVIGLGARALWRVGSRVKGRVAAPIDDPRLDRLEAAVDAIAIEVERISESQRFTVGLLSERLPPRGVDRVAELPSPAGAKRVNTPH